MDNHWYRRIYRRNLVDMHIDDWDEKFLSEFSPEVYVENLKRAKVEAAMIYLQSHVGLCYYPTSSARMHRALEAPDRQDMIRKTVDICHKEGIYVVGYYSLIFNNWAEENHPEWAMVRTNGGATMFEEGARYGYCCPNNEGYRAFLKEQIAEIATHFTLDGVFYDMTFWPTLCACEACLTRLKRETGLKGIPATDWQDQDFLRYYAKRREWMGEFARFVTDETKRLLPGIPAEHNFAAAVSGDWSHCCTEVVNDACDYCGGDLYGDSYSHSFAAKYYKNITKNLPFEYMTCRCDHTLRQHTVSKSETHLTADVLLTAAHHGATLLIDGIDPVGTQDSRAYDRMGKAFEKQILYEPYFKGEMVEDVGVFYSAAGRYDPEGTGIGHEDAAVRVIQTLSEAHIPVGVLSEGCIERLGSYRAVVAPMIRGLSERAQKALIAYVKNGGRLYVSGVGEAMLLRELLSAELDGYTKEETLYIAPVAGAETLFCEFNAKYPMPAEHRLPIIKGVRRECVLATLTRPYTDLGRELRPFASIHSDPPGISTEIPTVVHASYGAGQILWSASPIEHEERQASKNVFLSLLTHLMRGMEFSFTAKAPKQVEITLFATEKGYVLHLFDHRSFHEVLPLNEISVKIKTVDEPIAITHVGAQISQVPYFYDKTAGTLTMEALPLRMFDTYEIVFKD